MYNDNINEGKSKTKSWRRKRRRPGPPKRLDFPRGGGREGVGGNTVPQNL